MARPRTNKAEVRERMLAALDGLIKRHGTARITVSEVAEACAMSQSNAYRFFASKQAMIEAGVERWFAGIDAELAAIATGDGSPEERLSRFLNRRYALKRQKHDTDPELFAAHMAVAAENPDAIRPHVARIRALLRRILADGLSDGAFSGASADALAQRVEILSEGFGDPVVIAKHRDMLTGDLVADAVDTIIAGLKAGCRGG